jgi:hypothetical protein
MFDNRVLFARKALAAAGIAGGLFVGLGGAADAQGFGWFNSPANYGAPAVAMISPAQIYRIIAANGYRITGGLRNNGHVYVADVTDRWGQPLRLVVDAYEGNIVQRFATAPPRPPAPVPQSHSFLGELFQPPRPESYPSYPEASLTPPSAPMAGPPVIAPQVGRAPKSDARQKKAVHKTQTASRETGNPTRARTVRSEAEPPRPASLVMPKSSPGPAPAAAAKHENVTAAASAKEAPAAVAPEPQPAAPVKPAPSKKDGPGYANGVPINPLD